MNAGDRRLSTKLINRLAQETIRTKPSRVDYEFFNYCSICALKYPKEVLRCKECNRKVRTKPWHRSKTKEWKRIWSGLNYLTWWSYTICKKICTQYKAAGSVDKFRYLNGQKRCNECEIFLKWNGLHCPCCGHRLRAKPRNLKAIAREKRLTLNGSAWYSIYFWKQSAMHCF